MQTSPIIFLVLALLLSGCDTLAVIHGQDTDNPVTADATAAGPELCGLPPGNSTAAAPLTDENLIREIQARLILMGYELGQIDGVYGKKTEKGIRAYQEDHQLLTDGWPSPELLEHLKYTQQLSGADIIGKVKKYASQ